MMTDNNASKGSWAVCRALRVYTEHSVLQVGKIIPRAGDPVLSLYAERPL